MKTQPENHNTVAWQTEHGHYKGVNSITFLSCLCASEAEHSICACFDAETTTKPTVQKWHHRFKNNDADVIDRDSRQLSIDRHYCR